MKTRRTITGFTLTEVLITLAIISVLAAIAIPSYQDTVRTARRHDAEDALMGLRQAVERQYARTGSYAGVADGAGIPQIFASQTPLEGSGHFYDLRIRNIGEVSYELVATPVEGQLGDACGTLLLNQTGQRGSALNDGRCWNGTTAYPAPP